MKYIISKDQYRRVLLKYLNSFVNSFIVGPKRKGFYFLQINTSDGTDFASLWFKGPVTKGCKKELSLHHEFLDDFESFIPINRKKVFSEVILEYFFLKTGIKCDCIDFEYYTGKTKAVEDWDNDVQDFVFRQVKDYDSYKYKLPKTK